MEVSPPICLASDAATGHGSSLSMAADVAAPPARFRRPNLLGKTLPWPSPPAHLRSLPSASPVGLAIRRIWTAASLVHRSTPLCYVTVGSRRPFLVTGPHPAVTARHRRRWVSPLIVRSPISAVRRSGEAACRPPQWRGCPPTVAAHHLGADLAVVRPLPSPLPWIRGR
ncbi:hypothetical protein ACLOJK_007523 [Asimina triloba]